MIKGIFTIEIENKNTGETRIIKKENAINPYYRWNWDFETIPNLLLIPNNADNTIYVNEGVISGIPNDFWYWYRDILYSYSYLWGTYPELKVASFTFQEKNLDDVGEHLYFSSAYLEGPFLLNGIMTHNHTAGRTGAGGSHYVVSTRLFSALEISSPYTITEEEKVKFNYEIIKEW